ncbi:MAG: hypothetical protein MUF42_15200 [Cytophagaceae bacterium]|nr:hypothetical protein [Cytophagaceae bacterium]
MKQLFILLSSLLFLSGCCTKTQEECSLPLDTPPFTFHFKNFGNQVIPVTIKSFRITDSTLAKEEVMNIDQNQSNDLVLHIAYTASIEDKFIDHYFIVIETSVTSDTLHNIQLTTSTYEETCGGGCILTNKKKKKTRRISYTNIYCELNDSTQNWNDMYIYHP